MSGRFPRYSDDDYDDEPRGMSGGKIAGIIVVLIIILVGIGAGIYFGVYYETEEQKKKRLEAEAAAAAKKAAEEAAKKELDLLNRLAAAKAADPSCNFQMTKTQGRVICPVGYDTKYNYGVNVAAACTSESVPCDRCIGTSYPQAWLDADATLKWEPPASIGPVSSGNRVMAWSTADGNIYVAEPKPIPTVAGQKCYV